MDEHQTPAEIPQAPYDIFLCTRELPDALTAETAALRQLCSALAAAGYRVFFPSALPRDLTDEERAEAIVSALRSARVMVAAGVGEEGADDPVAAKLRESFLALAQEDPARRLIACWRDAAPEQLARELSDREVLDMSDLGFLVTLNEQLAGIFAVPEPEELCEKAPAPEAVKKPFPWKWVLLCVAVAAAVAVFFLIRR